MYFVLFFFPRRTVMGVGRRETERQRPTEELVMLTGEEGRCHTICREEAFEGNEQFPSEVLSKQCRSARPLPARLWPAKLPHPHPPQREEPNVDSLKASFHHILKQS
jgi:hypothetical protein